MTVLINIASIFNASENNFVVVEISAVHTDPEHGLPTPVGKFFSG